MRVACPFGDCDPTAGTPIVVGADATVAGIDFAISRGGSISGALTEAATGDPIPFAGVNLTDEGGVRRTAGITDVDGRYQISGLNAGTYLASTRAS